MNRIKKRLQKDQYGIVRGSMGIALLLILSVCLFVCVLTAYSTAAEERRAENAAEFVVSGFEQLVDRGFGQMKIVAALLDSDAPEGALLEALDTYGPFRDAGVVFAGEIRRADGGTAPIDGDVSYIHYDATERYEKVIAQADGAIQLRVPLADQGELAAWIDPEYLDAVLCSAFSEDYDFAVYNATTGVYLLNRTPFSEGGYYDALLSINDDGGVEALLNAGDGQARVRGGASGDCYIAQKQTGIGPWSIALIIPRELVANSAWTFRMMPYLVIAVGVLLLAAVAGGAAFALRRLRVSNRNAERALDVGERMLTTAAREARATLFVYRRGHDGMTPCYDGLGLVGGTSNGMQFSSLSTVLAACGLDEEDVERLHERIHGLSAGESAELNLRCAARGREEQTLRFVLTAPVDDGDTVIVSIQDCTLRMMSEFRAEEERSYRLTMEAKAASIWQIDVGHDRWCAIYIRNPEGFSALGISAGVWRDRSAELNGVLRDHLHPADAAAYGDVLSLSNLTEMYRSGRMQFTQDYRIRPDGQEEYEWHRVQVRLSYNADLGGILANAYVFNVDAAKNAALERGERKRILSQTLTALGGIYYGLYYVDLEKDICYAAKPHGGELAGELCSPYKATFDAYIESSVHPSDREAMRNLLSAYNLRRSMTEGSHFQRCEYRRRTGEGYGWAVVTVQPARFENGSVREVVIALSNTERDSAVDE